MLIRGIYLREPLQIILHPILNLGLCSLGAYEKNTNQFFSANNGNVQSNVQGWKRIYSNTSGTVTLYRNQDLFRLRGDDHSVSLTSSNAWQDRMSFADYFKPDTIYYSITSSTNTIFCRILSSGQFQMKNTSGSSFNSEISFAILGKLDES